MSRKSRLKKKNKQKLQKRFEQAAPESEVDVDDDAASDKPVQSDSKKAIESSVESDSIIDAPTRKLISRDVRMIIFTLVGLALALVAIRILEFKTPYIDTFGNWLYKITNIQTM